jgi:hypothetical protein
LAGLATVTGANVFFSEPPSTFCFFLIDFILSYKSPY